MSSSGPWPVDLIQVDCVDAEPCEAAFGLAKDRVTLQVVHHGPAGSWHERRLREHIGAFGEARKCAPDDLLRAAQPVRRSGVDPVHAHAECPLDGLDRRLVVLGSPAELPFASSDRPRAEANAGDLHPGTSELRRPELRLLHRSSSCSRNCTDSFVYLRAYVKFVRGSGRTSSIPRLTGWPPNG